MTPRSPVIPGSDLCEIVFAKDQPEYLPLPAVRNPDGMVTTRWRLTWRERLKIALAGDLWLQILTFNRPLQPVMLTIDCPKVESIKPPKPPGPPDPPHLKERMVG